MRLPRLLLILFAVYFVLVGGGVYYTQIFAVRVLHHALLSVVLLVWLALRLRRGRGLPRTPLNPWIYAAVGVWLLSVAFSLDPRVSLETGWSLLTNVLIFFALVDLFQSGRAGWVFEAQFMVGALVVMLALYQLASWYFGLGIFPGTEIGWVEVSLIPLRWLSLTMPMGVTTWLAAYTAPLGVFTAAWALSIPPGTPNRRAARYALGALAAGLLLVAALTFSRGGFIALGVSLAVLVGLRAAPRLLAQRRFWLIGLIAAGIAAGVLLVVILISRDPSRLYGDALRADLWRSAVSIIRDHPLTGVGIGQFGRAFRLYRDPTYVDDRLSSAHNLYLNTAAETGLIGLLVGLGLVAALARLWRRRWRTADAPAERWRLEAAGAALVGFGAQSLFDTFTLPALVTLPLLLAAYIAAEPRSRADAVMSPARATHPIFGAAAAVLVAAYGVFFFQWDQAHAAFNRSVASASLDDARAAVSGDPALLLYTLHTAYLTAQTAPTPAEAIANYEFAVALEPTWDKGWLNLAALYLREGSPGAALEALERARAISRYNGAALIWAQTAEATEAAPQDEIVQNYIWGMGSVLYLPLSDYWTATPLRRLTLEQNIPNLPLDRQYRVWAVHDPTRAAALVPAAPATAAEWWIVGEHALTIENDPVRAADAFTQAIALDGRNGDLYASRARALLGSDPDAANRDLKFAALLGTLDEYPNAIRAQMLAIYEAALFGLRASALPPVIIDQNFDGVLYAGRVASFRPLPEVRAPGPGAYAMQPWYDIANDFERAGQTEDAARIYRAILDYAPDEMLARERLEGLTLSLNPSPTGHKTSKLARRISPPLPEGEGAGG